MGVGGGGGVGVGVGTGVGVVLGGGVKQCRSGGKHGLLVGVGVGPEVVRRGWDRTHRDREAGAEQTRAHQPGGDQAQCEPEGPAEAEPALCREAAPRWSASVASHRSALPIGGGGRYSRRPPRGSAGGAGSGWPQFGRIPRPGAAAGLASPVATPDPIPRERVPSLWSMAARTPLHSRHLAAHAVMVEFAGYEMPLRYSSMRDEHVAVRTRAGLFDLSHMGEVRLTGSSAEATVQRLVANDVSQPDPGPRPLLGGLQRPCRHRRRRAGVPRGRRVPGGRQRLPPPGRRGLDGRPPAPGHRAPR